MKCPACEQDVPAEAGAPVAWQYRTEIEAGIDAGQWGGWRPCTEEIAKIFEARDLEEVPKIETRALYAAPSPAWRPVTEAEAGEIARRADFEMGHLRWVRSADLMRLIDASRRLGA